jgi:hypothetical protein
VPTRRTFLLGGAGAAVAGAVGAGVGVEKDVLPGRTFACGAPFVIAAADGGRGYWHPHDGDDAGAMVLDEFLPLFQEQGREWTSRVGWLGWSMGGYGALLDIGRGDPFYFEVEEYAVGLGADSEAGHERGGHTPGY